MPILTSKTTTAGGPAARGRDELGAYLALLAGSPRPGELLELRHRLPDGGMTSSFYPADQRYWLAHAIHRYGCRADVYVGAAPRTRRHGGRDAISRSWVLWAECDTPTARAALEAFTPTPTLVIASGSPHGRHAYWALTTPADTDQLEDANQRLASCLGADLACVDAPRILRPPRTLNFKRTPAGVVTTVLHHPDRRYELADVLARLPPAPGPGPRQLGALAERARGGDPLIAITPDAYVPVLLGQPIGPSRKVACPFHADRTPSLHAYPDHWFCFSCRTGGTIYDLAGRLWNLDTRGLDFIELRDRLQGLFAAPQR